MDTFAKYHELVEGAYQEKKLSKAYYESLIKRNAIDLYELDHCYQELKHATDHAEYYITLDRITKGEEMLAETENPVKKSEYRKLLNDLTIKLDSLMPRARAHEPPIPHSHRLQTLPRRTMESRTPNDKPKKPTAG